MFVPSLADKPDHESNDDGGDNPRDVVVVVDDDGEEEEVDGDDLSERRLSSARKARLEIVLSLGNLSYLYCIRWK